MQRQNQQEGQNLPKALGLGKIFNSRVFCAPLMILARSYPPVQKIIWDSSSSRFAIGQVSSELINGIFKTACFHRIGRNLKLMLKSRLPMKVDPIPDLSFLSMNFTFKKRKVDFILCSNANCIWERQLLKPSRIWMWFVVYPKECANLITTIQACTLRAVVLHFFAQITDGYFR